MSLLKGKDIAEDIYSSLKTKIENLKQNNIIPGLTVILVGDRKDSETYVSMKNKKCLELGIKSNILKFNSDVDEETLISNIDSLNLNSTVHGILIQLPLPTHINPERVLSRVVLNKDVDGFHYENIGRLATNKNPTFKPCTPDGCMELIKKTNIDISGKHAVILGRSNIVGLPIALMLLHSNATVTICHSKTQNIEEHTKKADIVIAACGKTEMVKKEWLKKDAIVIDVGINSVTDETKKRGYRLVGDVDFNNAKDVASFITPVPGGVGPMTIAMLMKHTVDACYNSNNDSINDSN
jgi:5,10-methylene-tetrahydrofolate dehydrogenase/methenyl tetrahydrofolate cyclohydrolase